MVPGQTLPGSRDIQQELTQIPADRNDGYRY